MRRIPLACFALLFGGQPLLAAELPVKAPTPAQQVAQQWEAALNSEVRYYSWSSNRGFPATAGLANADGKGSQIYVPTALQLNGPLSDDVKVEFLVRTGYFSSRQTTIGMTGDAAGLTDTTLSTTLAYNGWAGMQPFVSLAINAPTGKSSLQGNATFARLDSDVVDLPTFGLGWNVGPTVGINIAVAEAHVVTFSAGYTYRGEFDREGVVGSTIPPLGPFGNTSLDPGEVTTLTVGFAHAIDRLTLEGSASYAVESKTTLNGTAFYRSGDRYVLTGSAAFAWTAFFNTKVAAAFQHQNRNQVAIPLIPDLIREQLNSNANVTQVRVDATYTNGPFSIGPTGGYVHRDRNSWDSTTLNFLPAKTKWSGGVAAQFSPAQTAALYLRMERLWLDEGANPGNLFAGPNGNPAVTTDAWVAIFGGLVKF
jgi:hypothetical protein